VVRWLNEAQDQWNISVPWPQMVEEEEFVCDGSATLLLPARVGAVMWIADKANTRALIKSDNFDREIPRELLGAQVGTPYMYREMGIDPIIKPNLSLGYLSVYATATDTAQIFIEGISVDSAASGYADAHYATNELITVVDNAIYTSVNQYVKITSLGKDKVTEGDYIFSGGGVGTIARLNKGEFRTSYRHIEIAPIPNQGTVIYVNFLRQPNPLVHTYQVSTPGVDNEYLIWYAAAMIREAQGEVQQAAGCFARAQQILDRKIYKERMFGDKDLRAMPDPNYWNDEDQYEVPTGGGF
jgi:hypothetical protein